MSDATCYKDVTLDQIHALIQRIEYAHKNHLSLTQDDYLLLLDALSSLLHLQVKISDHEITVQKLRKLIGVVSSSERLKKTENPDTTIKNKSNQQERKKKT
jgi:transposase